MLLNILQESSQVLTVLIFVQRSIATLHYVGRSIAVNHLYALQLTYPVQLSFVLVACSKLFNIF